VDKITAIKLACEDLEKSIEDLLDDTNDDENIAVKKLNFETEQLNLALTRHPQYSTEMFLWASSLFFQFPGG
jgi:hypothetical protein